VRRYELHAHSVRLGTGLFALGLLLTAELSLVLGLRGLTFKAYIAERDPVGGAVYLFSLLVFAFMPLFNAPKGAGSKVS